MELVILEGKMGPGTHSPDTLQAAHLPGIHWASFFLETFPTVAKARHRSTIARPLCPRPRTGLLRALSPAAAECRDPFITLYLSHRGGMQGR